LSLTNSPRGTCPGRLVGVSKGAWIESDVGRMLACTESWCETPDCASVNLAELGVPMVMERLWQHDVGVDVEAGLANMADADRLTALRVGSRILRVLDEMEQQSEIKAMAVGDGIETVLARAGLRRPVL